MELTSSPTTYKGPEPGSPEQIKAIIEELRGLYPDAKCTLNFSNPLELLIATQLAAQCTDERVNMVTEKLFQKYRSPEDYVNASQEELEQDIKQTGFYRNKAKNIRAACQRIITEYGSEVPQTMAGLLSLAGVARKTANVVLGNAFGIVEGFTVAVKVEQDLMRIIPREDWFDLSHLLIFHGRTICNARRPLCEQCSLAPLCPSAFVAIKNA